MSSRTSSGRSQRRLFEGRGNSSSPTTTRLTARQPLHGTRNRGLLRCASSTPQSVVAPVTRGTREQAVARGTFLCFVDADDRVDPQWLDMLARDLDGADALGGQVIAFGVGRDGTESITDPGSDALPTHRLGFLPNASTANFCVRRQLFEELGGFDGWFGTGEDIDFSWRLQLAGHELRLARDAVVFYRERDGLADLARQFFHYGEAMPPLYRKFRACGMPRSSTRDAARAWLEICVLWVVAWSSRRARRGWTKLAAQRAGRIAGSLRHRVLYL
jgi:GT2 family glycosyltransferase